MTDTKNIETIIEQYNSKIQTTIKKFLGTNSDVDDIKQEVYIKTWKNLPKHQGKTNIWNWINKITVNTCKDYLRASKKTKLHNTNDNDEIIENIPAKTQHPGNAVIFTERHKLILNAINKLSPKLKEVITLYDIEEYTYEEIAQKLKCPIGTVKSRLFTARKLLKQDLTDLLN